MVRVVGCGVVVDGFDCFIDSAKDGDGPLEALEGTRITSYLGFHRLATVIFGCLRPPWTLLSLATSTNDRGGSSTETLFDVVGCYHCRYLQAIV